MGRDRARLTLTIEMRGLLIPIIGLFYRDLTNRYMTLEAEGMKPFTYGAKRRRVVMSYW